VLQKWRIEKDSIQILVFTQTAIGIRKIISIGFQIRFDHVVIIENSTRPDIQIAIQANSPKQFLSQIHRILESNEIERHESNNSLFIQAVSDQLADTLLIKILQWSLGEYGSDVLQLLSADSVVSAQVGYWAVRLD